MIIMDPAMGIAWAEMQRSSIRRLLLKTGPSIDRFGSAKKDLNFEQNCSKMPPIRSMLRIPAHDLLASPQPPHIDPNIYPIEP